MTPPALSFADAYVALAKAEGLYVGRAVTNQWELREWLARQGYKLDPYPHVTVLFSTTSIPWVDREDYLRATVTGWRILGEDNAVVLTISCPELDVRWQNAIKAGAVSTYDTYVPHVTLFYLGADADTSSFVLPSVPTFDIYLGEERSAPLGEKTKNVFKSTLDMAEVFKAIRRHPAGTPGGKGGQFAPANSPGSLGVTGIAYHRGGVVQPAGPGYVAGAITKYDTAEVVKMRAAAKNLKQTYLLQNRGHLQAAGVAAVYGNGAKVKGKEAHIVIGGPGSGKSEIAEKVLAPHMGALLVDADELKKHLPEYNGGKGAGAVHEESLAMTATLLRKAVAAGDNIVLPTTGRTHAYVDGIIDQLKRNGYTVHVSIANVDVDTAVARTLDRAADTGRFVDPQYTAFTVGTNPQATFAKLANDKRVATSHKFDTSGAAPSYTGSKDHRTGVVTRGGPHTSPFANPPGGVPIVPGPTPGVNVAQGPTSGTSHVTGTPPVQRLNSAVITASQVTPGSLVTISGALQARLSSGTSSMPKTYNSAVQQLQLAFQQHGNNPAQLNAAIQAIKGPPAAHSFGKKFAALKAQALSLAAVSAPRPSPPSTPVLPSNLPSNKATWNGNTLLRIQQHGTNPTLTNAQTLQLLNGISISKSHHPMVKAYHSAMIAYHSGPSAGPMPGQTPAVPALTTAGAAPSATPRAAAVPVQTVQVQRTIAVPTPGKVGINTKTVSWQEGHDIKVLTRHARAGNWQQVADMVNAAPRPSGALRAPLGPVALQYGQALQAFQQKYNVPQGQGHATQMVTQKVRPGVQALAPLTITQASLPAPPALNPAFAQHATNFNARIQAMQQAATGPNPLQALASFNPATPDFKNYKATLVAHVMSAQAAHQAAQQAAGGAVASVQRKKKANKLSSTFAAQQIDSYREALHPSLAAMGAVRDLIRAGDQAAIQRFVHTTQQGDHQLAAVYKAQGFDGLPKVVDRQQFDAIVKGGGLEMFRTVNAIPGRRAKKLAEDFMSGDYYAGFGVFGNGTYVAVPAKGTKPAWGERSDTAARQDSSHYARHATDAVMFRMAIRPDAKIGNTASITKSQRATLQHLNNLRNVARQSNDKAEALKLDREIDFHRDLGRHAASQGYDAYTATRGGNRYNRGKKGHNSLYMVVLNRTAVAVRRETEDPKGNPVD